LGQSLPQVVVEAEKRVSTIEMLIVDCSLQAAKRERVALGGCLNMFLDMAVEL
jgi:hypothetical protein